MYEYNVRLVRVVDGDTVDVDLDLGFGVWLRNERVRIIGIDTPESRTSDKMEKIFGLAAKERLSSLLGALIVSSSRDLLTIFIGIELASTPMFLLSGWKKGDRKSNEGAIKFFLLGVLVPSTSNTK